MLIFTSDELVLIDFVHSQNMVLGVEFVASTYRVYRFLLKD